MFMKKKQMATYFFMAQLMLFMLILTVNILKLMS
jgi:membrane-associated protease RseP (regulator of RpoE activity)